MQDYPAVEVPDASICVSRHSRKSYAKFRSYDISSGHTRQIRGRSVYDMSAQYMGSRVAHAPRLVCGTQDKAGTAF